MQLVQRIAAAGTRALSWSVDVVMPPVCAGCGVAGVWMCADCARELVTIDQADACRRCGYPHCGDAIHCRRCREWSEELNQARAAFEFGGPIRHAIHRVKYRGEHARAAWCAEMLPATLASFSSAPDAICAVPLTRRRKRTRGFNQSEMIARKLSEISGIPLIDALQRVRETPPQVGLSAIERKSNVQGAFRARMRLDGLSLVIIDDVLTTGSTMQACAQAAVQGGAAHVAGLTLATETWG